MTQGKIGFYRAGRARRLLQRHVAQLITALEVPPREPLQLPDGQLGPTDPEYYRRIGMTDRAAVLRARKVLRQRIEDGQA